MIRAYITSVALSQPNPGVLYGLSAEVRLRFWSCLNPTDAGVERLIGFAWLKPLTDALSIILCQCYRSGSTDFLIDETTLYEICAYSEIGFCL